MAFPIGAALFAGGSILSGLLGQKSPSGGFSRGDLDIVIAQRQREIDSFRQELASSRARLTGRIGKLQEMSFKRFGGLAEAQFGTRGLQVTGGAFQSTLAKRAADLQAEQDIAIAKTERQDILAEQNLRGTVFGQRLGGLSTIGAQGASAGLQQQKAFGGLAGELGISALGGFSDFLKRQRQPRSVVRGATGGFGEEGIRAFRNIIG